MTRNHRSVLPSDGLDVSAKATRPGRRLLALGLVVVAVLALVFVRELSRPPVPDSAFPAEIEAALTSGLPMVFVFTHSGDCCPDVEEFFTPYNEAVYEVTREFTGQAVIVWIDISLMENPAVAEAVGELAGRFSVTHVPTVLVVSPSGELVDLLVGPADPEGIRAAIARSMESEG